MAKSRFQLRGHCQRCGNQQAVKNGTMVHHGYTVRNGWFQGSCSGRSFQPIEWSRATLDKTVEAIRNQCADLRISAAALEDQANWPKTIKVWDRHTRKDVEWPLSSFSPLKQQEHINGMKYGMLNRATIGEQHADYLLQVADLYHGRDLIEVERKAA